MTRGATITSVLITLARVPSWALEKAKRVPNGVSAGVLLPTLDVDTTAAAAAGIGGGLGGGIGGGIGEGGEGGGGGEGGERGALMPSTLSASVAYHPSLLDMLAEGRHWRRCASASRLCLIRCPCYPQGAQSMLRRLLGCRGRHAGASLSAGASSSLCTRSAKSVPCSCQVDCSTGLGPVCRVAGDGHADNG